MTHTCTYMSTRSRTHTLAHTRRCPCTRINTQHTDGHTVARTHMTDVHTHAYRQMYTHTYTQTDVHTHAYAQTHTHRQMSHTDRCPTQTDVPHRQMPHTDRCPHTHLHTGRCPNSDFGIERVKFGLYC